MRENYLCIIEKNSPDSPWIIFYFMRKYALPYLTNLSGRMAQMTHFVS
jgi:hypothetical protein